MTETVNILDKFLPMSDENFLEVEIDGSFLVDRDDVLLLLAKKYSRERDGSLG